MDVDVSEIKKYGLSCSPLRAEPKISKYVVFQFSSGSSSTCSSSTRSSCSFSREHRVFRTGKNPKGMIDVTTYVAERRWMNQADNNRSRKQHDPVAQSSLLLPVTHPYELSPLLRSKNKKKWGIFDESADTTPPQRILLLAHILPQSTRRRAPSLNDDDIFKRQATLRGTMCFSPIDRCIHPLHKLTSFIIQHRRPQTEQYKTIQHIRCCRWYTIWSKIGGRRCIAVPSTLLWWIEYLWWWSSDVCP